MYQICRSLLKKSPKDAKRKGKEDLLTPLHLLCRNRSSCSIVTKQPLFDLLKEMEEAGANFNATCKLENTPLHYCIKAGQTKLAIWLLLRKANPNIQNNEGNTPLHEVLYRDLTRGKFENEKIIEHLCSHGVDWKLANKKNMTCLKIVTENKGIMGEYLKFLPSSEKISGGVESVDLKTSSEIKKVRPARRLKPGEDQPVLGRRGEAFPGVRKGPLIEGQDGGGSGVSSNSSSSSSSSNSSGSSGGSGGSGGSGSSSSSGGSGGSEISCSRIREFGGGNSPRERSPGGGKLGNSGIGIARNFSVTHTQSGSVPPPPERVFSKMKTTVAAVTAGTGAGAEPPISFKRQRSNQGAVERRFVLFFLCFGDNFSFFFYRKKKSPKPYQRKTSEVPLIGNFFVPPLFHFLKILILLLLGPVLKEGPLMIWSASESKWETIYFVAQG